MQTIYHETEVQVGIKTMLCEMIIANKVEYVCFT